MVYDFRIQDSAANSPDRSPQKLQSVALVSGDSTVYQSTPHIVRNRAGSSTTASVIAVVDVDFDNHCGWAFDHWEISTYQDGATTVTTSAQNPCRYTVNDPGSFVNTLYITFDVVATYAGTGKLVRSYAQPSKLIRVGGKLLRDD